MRELDETDLEILQLLLSDARRPYSEVADMVGLSPPAVSDRIARLQEVGVIKRFTIDVDRSQLDDGLEVLVDVDVASDTEAVREALLDLGAVEHVFTTATGDVVCYARAPDSDVAGWLHDVLPDGSIADVDVTLLAGADWAPNLAGTAFGLTCAECGNTADAEGTARRIDDSLYLFCCSSCEARFTEKYEELKQGM